MARDTRHESRAAPFEAKFPTHRYASAEEYAHGYLSTLTAAAAMIDLNRVAAAAALIERTFDQSGTIYSAGNGGSAAIANHLLCDYSKSIQTDTNIRPRAVSLSASIEIITAIANDISYDDVFVYQLRTLARPGDTLLTISSSGNSENIVRAIAWARENQVASIALTGFDGGRSAKLADVNIHVPVFNYGIVEDLHQAIMQMMAQFLRQRTMPEHLLKERRL